MKCSSVYISQTGRSLKQCVSEHRRALKNGDIQTSTLAEHVLNTGHAVDFSQSEVLDHHQHTTTRCMLESWYIQHNQAVLNREQGTTTGSVCGAPGLMGMYPLVTLFFGFLSIVNNLTQHWCAWDHAVCMYKGTPQD